MDHESVRQPLIQLSIIFVCFVLSLLFFMHLPDGSFQIKIIIIPQLMIFVPFRFAKAFMLSNLKFSPCNEHMATDTRTHFGNQAS